MAQGFLKISRTSAPVPLVFDILVEIAVLFLPEGLVLVKVSALPMLTAQGSCLHTGLAQEHSLPRKITF